MLPFLSRPGSLVQEGAALCLICVCLLHLQEGLAALPALASLTSLSLSLCKLRDENVEALTTLTGMQRLELGQFTNLAACCLCALGQRCCLLYQGYLAMPVLNAYWRTALGAGSL